MIFTWVALRHLKIFAGDGTYLRGLGVDHEGHPELQLACFALRKLEANQGPYGLLDAIIFGRLRSHFAPRPHINLLIFKNRHSILIAILNHSALMQPPFNTLKTRHSSRDSLAISMNRHSLRNLERIPNSDQKDCKLPHCLQYLMVGIEVLYKVGDEKCLVD